MGGAPPFKNLALPRQTTRAAALFVAVAAATSLGLTFLQQLVIADLFGAGHATDAYLIAQILPVLLGSQFMWTATSVSIPLLTEAELKGGRAERWRILVVLLGTTSVAAVCGTLLFGLSSGRIIGVLGGGLGGPTLRTAQNLFLLMLPALVFLTLSGVPRAMLHFTQNFAVPSSAQACLPLCVIGGALILSKKFGIYSLAFGALAGAFILFCVLFISLNPIRQLSGAKLSPWLPVVRAAAKQLGPTLVCLSVTQVYMIVARSLAAGLASGSVASVVFSASIMSIPMQLFATTLGTVIFPRVSALAGLKKVVEARDLITRAMRMVLFAVTPFVVFFLLFPSPIVRYVLQRGAFGAADTQRTALVLIGFAGGLPGLALNQVALFSMIAISEWSVAAKFSTLSIVIDIAISYVLRARWGLLGVALGASLAASCNAIVLLGVLRRRLGRFPAGTWGPMAWKLALPASAAAGASWATFHVLLAPAFNSGYYWQGFCLLTDSLLVGLAVFAAGSFLVRSRELGELLEALKHVRREVWLPAARE